MTADNKPDKGRHKGVLVGAYVPPEVKAALIRMAKARKTSVSKIMLEILTASVRGKGNGK
jgi:Holliday junction resolvasome RuvABC endonuclease subunit